jgi:hypothetical protein
MDTVNRRIETKERRRRNQQWINYVTRRIGRGGRSCLARLSEVRVPEWGDMA